MRWPDVYSRISMGKLKWAAILAPAGLFLAWEYISHFLLHEQVASERSLFLLTVLVAGLGASGFTLGLFRLLERLQSRVMLQNRELSSRTAALETLYEIGTGLAALLDTAAIKQTAVRRSRQLLRSDTAGLALLYESTGDVHWELVEGAQSEEVKRLRVRLGQCVAGQAIQSGEPVIIEDVNPDAEGLRESHPLLVVENLRAALVVPVRVAGSPVGALMVGHRAPYTFHLNDLKLLTSIANQVAVALNNARLYEQLGALSALEEREQLAREMHDSLAQLLGNITAGTAAAEGLLRQGRVEQAHRRLGRLRDTAQDAYNEVRRAILGLRTAPSSDHDLLETLEEFAARLTQQDGLPVRVELAEDLGPLDLDPGVEVQAIRIIQEGLSNARRHAEASGAWVRVTRDAGGVVFVVQDDGRGFDTASTCGQDGHFGLAMMRERAEAVGGSLTVDSAPGRGTVVRVWMPAREEP